jgi:hypothetical protein
MITTGSKLLYGLGSLSIVAAIVWFIANDGGSIGVVALASVATALIFLGAIASFIRDGHVLSTEIAAHATAPAARRSVRRSWWPLGLALSVGFMVVGLVSSPGIFKVGIALVFAMLGEWMVSNWAERASANSAYNEKVRSWVVHPLEIPIAASLILAVVVLSFSRIMLSLSKEAGPIVFAIAGALILFVGAMFSIRRGTSRNLIAVVCGIVLVGLSGVGIALALDGEREQLVEAAAEDHFAHRACGTESDYSDKKPARSVAAKSSVAAIVTLKDGKLTATQDGFQGELTSITLQRANPSLIIFRNEDPAKHRMVLSYGKVVEDLGGGVEREVALEACTSLIEKGNQQSVIVSIPKPSFASEEPYSITVPGLEGTAVEVLVS